VKWIWDPHCNVYVYQVHWAALGACTACRIDNRSSLFVHNSFVLIGLLLIFVLSLAYEMRHWISGNCLPMLCSLDIKIYYGVSPVVVRICNAIPVLNVL
jgi:hypothetical protein